MKASEISIGMVVKIQQEFLGDFHNEKGRIIRRDWYDENRDTGIYTIKFFNKKKFSDDDENSFHSDHLVADYTEYQNTIYDWLKQ